MSRSSTTARFASVLHLTIAATLVFGVSIRAEAATYYVSLSGSDAQSCAIAQNLSTPKRTIAAGVACLNPGDTLYIRGGTYQTSGDVIDSSRFRVPSGTSRSNAVTIAGFPNEKVVMQPPNNTHAVLLTTGAPAYIVVQDVTLDYMNDTSDREGIYLGNGAHHNVFQRVEVKNSSNFGIVFAYPAAFNTFKDGSVHNCGTMRVPGGPQGTNIQRGHAFHSLASDDIVENNDIYDNEGYGIDYYNNYGPQIVSRNVIRNNRVWGNGKNHSSAYGISIAWGSDNLIYNNLVYGNKGGILVYSNAANTGVYNNTITGNTDQGMHLEYYTSAPVVRNNIVYGNGAGIVDYGGRAVQDHNLTSNPLFVNRAANDFRLTSSSPARDAGAVAPEVQGDLAGVARPQNGAYDMGAFEYSEGSSSSTPPAPVTGIRITLD